MADEQKFLGCAQGDPPKGATSSGVVKGLCGDKPAKPKKPAKKDEGE